MNAPSPRAAVWRRGASVMLAVALPWIWFAVRERGGVFDAVAVGLPLIGVAAIVGSAIAAVATRRAWMLLVGVSTAAVCAAAVLSPRLPVRAASPEPSVRLVTANVWKRNTAPALAVRDLFRRGADLVAAVEMPDGRFAARMTEEAAASGLARKVGSVGLSVWSRFPLRELSDTRVPGGRVMRVAVDAPGSPFVLYVVHALNPLDETTFEDQRRFTEELLAGIEAEPGPVVLTGDFNMSDRTVSYRMVQSRMLDAMRIADIPGNSYVGGWWRAVLLRIDHVFVDRSWCADDPVTFAVPGSDHRGVGATIGPCPS